LVDRIILTPDLKTKLKAVKRHLKDSGRKGRIKWSDCVDHIFQEVKDLRKDVRELRSQLEGQPDKKGPTEQTPAVDPTATTTHQCPHYSFDPSIEKVLCSKDFNRGGRIHKIPQEVCDKHWEEIKKTWTEEDVSEVECLSRYEDRGAFFCVKNPPKAVKLLHGLKTCKACPDRLTKQRADDLGLILTTRKYVTCGALEKKSETVGLMLRCPKTNEWCNIRLCEEIECPQFKTIQAYNKPTT